MPYLISNGRAYPVEIKGDTVTVDEKNGTIAEGIGGYSLREIKAKLGDNVSSIKKKSKKKGEENDVL